MEPINLKNCFIKATQAYNTFENPVPAYYFRRSFTGDSQKTARLDPGFRFKYGTRSKSITSGTYRIT